MSIVLDEYDWAERAIINRDLGQNKFEALTRVAKYFYANHYSKRDIRHKLDLFLSQCDPSALLLRWSDTLDKIVKNVEKYPLVRIDGIELSKAELDAIETLRGIQVKRLAFTLLCVAKYRDAVSERNDHWVNTPDREVMRMANITASIKRQSAMFAYLRDAGFIRFSKQVDNLNVRVLFCHGGDTALVVHDYRNLGYQYMKYCGGPFFECSACGITVRYNGSAKGRKQKYCSECAAQIHTKQKVESVMRQRSFRRQPDIGEDSDVLQDV